MNKYKIGDIVYTTHNDEIHSCIVIGMECEYIRNSSVSTTDAIIKSYTIKYSLATIVQNKNGTYQVEGIYGEHIKTEDKLFSNLEDAINNIKTIKNIISK